MPCLRIHAKDPAIGMIGQTNCELVADALTFVAAWARHPLFKWVCPYRRKGLTLALIAAAFSRVKGASEESPSQFDAQVRMAMEVPRGH